MFILYQIKRNMKIDPLHFHNPEDIRRKAPTVFKPISKSERGFPNPDHYPSWYEVRFGVGRFQIRECMGGKDGIKKRSTFTIRPEEEEEDHSFVELPEEEGEDEEED